MIDTLKIVTWNIGGAHTVGSAKQFDYEKEDLPYFVDMLRAQDADIVCLQESHTNDNDSLAKRLAEQLNLPYVFDSPRSPSHIDANYQLSNAILSRFPIEHTQHILLPDPPFELFFSNGSKARLFHTYVQVATIEGVQILNTHLQPLHLFGYSYSEGEGKVFGEACQEVMLHHMNRPLVFAGDFNDPQLEVNFGKMFTDFALSPALDNQPTDIKGNKMDYILYSPEFELTAAEVVKADKADHHLGVAELRRVDI